MRSFAGERANDWPALVPLVGFAINDSASPLGTCYTPFYADRGQHPLLHQSQRAAAHLMGRVTAEVRALVEEQRGALRLPAGRAVRYGDEVLLDTEHTPLPSRSLLSTRWMGPFQVLARTAQNTNRLDIPATWRIFPEVNVERLRAYLRRPTASAATRMPAHRQRLARTVCPSTRCRSCSSLKSAMGGRTYLCAGQA